MICDDLVCNSSRWSMKHEAWSISLSKCKVQKGFSQHNGTRPVSNVKRNWAHMLKNGFSEGKISYGSLHWIQHSSSYGEPEVWQFAEDAWYSARLCKRSSSREDAWHLERLRWMEESESSVEQGQSGQVVCVCTTTNSLPVNTRLALWLQEEHNKCHVIHRGEWRPTQRILQASMWSLCQRINSTKPRLFAVTQVTCWNTCCITNLNNHLQLKSIFDVTWIAGSVTNVSLSQIPLYPIEVASSRLHFSYFNTSTSIQWLIPSLTLASRTMLRVAAVCTYTAPPFASTQKSQASRSHKATLLHLQYHSFICTYIHTHTYIHRRQLLPHSTSQFSQYRFSCYGALLASSWIAPWP